MSTFAAAAPRLRLRVKGPKAPPVSAKRRKQADESAGGALLEDLIAREDALLAKEQTDQLEGSYLALLEDVDYERAALKAENLALVAENSALKTALAVEIGSVGGDKTKSQANLPEASLVEHEFDMLPRAILPGPWRPECSVCPTGYTLRRWEAPVNTQPSMICSRIAIDLRGKVTKVSGGGFGHVVPGWCVCAAEPSRMKESFGEKACDAIAEFAAWGEGITDEEWEWCPASEWEFPFRVTFKKWEEPEESGGYQQECTAEWDGDGCCCSSCERSREYAAEERAAEESDESAE